MQYAYGKGRKHRAQPVFEASNPHGVAICDGCGFLVQHSHLREKKDYRGGTTPVGLSLWVCASCDDVPQPYYRRLLLKPDPVPLNHPRIDTQDAQTNAQETAANAYSIYLNQLYGLAP
jgi:hypothetical protein